MESDPGRSGDRLLSGSYSIWYQIRFLRSPPYGTVAQQVEHLIEAQGRVGSIPAGSTNMGQSPSGNGIAL